MTEIETRLFRYFVGLAEEQHFGRAAMNLGISAPTLTQQIKKLEQQLGAKLVQRRGNTHVELTEAGLRVLDRARAVLREAKEAVAVARQAARGEVAGDNLLRYLAMHPYTAQNIARNGLEQRVREEVGAIPFVLVINKSDLFRDWELDPELESQLAAQGWNILHSSAKTGEGVEESFSLLARKMLG